MANWHDPDWLVGRAFSCAFRVLDISAPDAHGRRVVRLAMHGGVYEVEHGELMALVERGFVVEAESGGERRH